MDITVCCSYGVIGNKGRCAYSIAPGTSVYDRVWIIVPDELIYGINVMEEPILILGKQRYALSDVLSNWGDEPALRWYDGAEHHIILKTR